MQALRTGSDFTAHALSVLKDDTPPPTCTSTNSTRRPCKNSRTRSRSGADRRGAARQLRYLRRRCSSPEISRNPPKRKAPAGAFRCLSGSALEVAAFSRPIWRRPRLLHFALGFLQLAFALQLVIVGGLADALLDLPATWLAVPLILSVVCSSRAPVVEHTQAGYGAGLRAAVSASCYHARHVRIFCLSSRHPTAPLFAKTLRRPRRADGRNVDGWGVASTRAATFVSTGAGAAGDSPWWCSSAARAGDRAPDLDTGAPPSAQTRIQHPALRARARGRMHLFAHMWLRRDRRQIRQVGAPFGTSLPPRRRDRFGDGFCPCWIAGAFVEGLHGPTLKARLAAGRNSRPTCGRSASPIPLQRRRIHFRPWPSPHAGRRHRGAAGPVVPSPPSRWHRGAGAGNQVHHPRSSRGRGPGHRAARSFP